MYRALSFPPALGARLQDLTPSPLYCQFSVYFASSAQPPTFEVRDRPFLLWVVANQFEFEVGNIPVALDFDESEIQPDERIVRTGLIHSRKVAHLPRARPAKRGTRTIDVGDEARSD